MPPALHHATHETGGTDALTQLSANILTSGTLPDARLSANVAMNGQAAAFTSLLSTPLNASNLTTGTVPDARLSANVALVNAANVFTAPQTMANSGTDVRFFIAAQGNAADMKRFMFHINNTGNLYIGGWNDAGNAWTPNYSYAERTTGNWNFGANVFSTGYFYPGRIHGPAGLQTSYYLAGSDTYGLHTNTGFHAAGSIWTDVNANVAGTLNVTGIATLSNALNVAGPVDFTGGSGTDYSLAPLEIRMANNPRVSFHWPGVVASQIGMDSAGVIRTYNNPGNAYEKFACLNIYTATTANSLGDLTCRGATNFQGGVSVSAGEISMTGSGYALVTAGLIYPGNVADYTQQRSYYLSYYSAFGGLYTNGPFCANGNILNYGYMYPGRADGSATYQLSWFIAGHSSYGLYINTGLYIVGNVWTGANIYVGALGWLGSAAVQNGISGTTGTILFNGVYVLLNFTNGVLTSVT